MIGAIVRLLRPVDWTKNLFVLPAIVFALPSLDAGDNETLLRLLGATLAAFIAFCLLTSGFYALNDVLDAKSDRLHPVKRRRPVASGELAPGVASSVGMGLIIAALALGFAINRSVGIVLVVYALLQTAYNLRLKRVMMVDVVTVALGFALRATAGVVAIGVPISIWLLLCVFYLCLYLALIKRLCDLTSAEAKRDKSTTGAWRSAAGYDDRRELNGLLAISGTLAMLMYLMYALSDHAWELFGARSLGFALLSPLVLIAMHRFFRRANLGVSDSPLEALVHDRTVLASVALFTIGIGVTLYVPGMERVLASVFVVHGGP